MHDFAEWIRRWWESRFVVHGRGGVLYVLSAFVTYLFTNAETVAGLMTLPATVGEFWILGYLITRGVRNRS